MCVQISHIVNNSQQFNVHFYNYLIYPRPTFATICVLALINMQALVCMHVLHLQNDRFELPR